MSYFYYDGPNAPMEPHVHKIFPSCLFEFPCFVDNQDDIISDLRSRWDTREIIPELAHMNFYTEDTLDKHPLYSKLCAKLLVAVRSVWKCYGYTDIDPYIVCMWANSLGKNASIQLHSHSNSFFSGVWYPDDVEIDHTDNGGCLKFVDPVKRHFVMPKVSASNELNLGEVIVRPKKGTLLIFPSWLEHGTIPNRNITDPRFSVSFNFWMKGELGNDHSLNRLNF